MSSCDLCQIIIIYMWAVWYGYTPDNQGITRITGRRAPQGDRTGRPPTT
nr:MAG TPA: hypothetical protein [Bacteriophage sp.]